MPREIAISVVVPVYNVKDYIGRCVQSILNQTFAQWELILVDDDSSDGSGEICREYASKNGRIRYERLEHGGQGVARNHGVSVARGKYVDFLDADDWLADDALELLYGYAEEHRADIILFDYYVYEETANGPGKRRNKLPIYLDGITNVRNRPDILYRVEGSVCDKFFRRDILIGAAQKGHPYEDAGILPFLLMRAERIGQLRKPLYYYWAVRKDSTVHTEGNVLFTLQSMEEMWHDFVACKEWTPYRNALQKYCSWMVFAAGYHIRKMVGQQGGQENYTSFLNKCEDFLSDAFPEYRHWKSLQVGVWGSYNLRCEINRCFQNRKIPSFCFNFSNIMSLMDKCEMKLRASHSNEYRDKMIQADLKQTFRKNIEQFAGVDYLVIDLMEERYPVAMVKERMLCYSDALRESDLCVEKVWTDRDEKYRKEWEQAADQFVELLKGHFASEQIIIVENYLCTHYGAYGMEVVFENIEQIERDNKWLRWCYHRLEEKLPDVTVIKNERSELEFTDSDYPHGCMPCHMNEYLYYEVAEKIIKRICK